MPDSKVLYMNLHKYVDAGEIPCPMDLPEPATVVTTFEGRPAYWKDGHIYVLEGTTELHPALDWVSRLNRRDNV